MSILKQTYELIVNRSTDQKVLFVSVPISPRKKFPSFSSTWPTVLEDLQTVPQWPLFNTCSKLRPLLDSFPASENSRSVRSVSMKAEWAISLAAVS